MKINVTFGKYKENGFIKHFFILWRYGSFLFASATPSFLFALAFLVFYLNRLPITQLLSYFALLDFLSNYRKQFLYSYINIYVYSLSFLCTSDLK